MASATPAMLPSPTVAETAEASAWKWVISPGSSLLEYFPVTVRSASLNALKLMKRKNTVRKRALPPSQTRMKGTLSSGFPAAVVALLL